MRFIMKRFTQFHLQIEFLPSLLLNQHKNPQSERLEIKHILS